VNKGRPVNLNLMTIQFPVTAIASILHRFSGVLLFLFIPVFLWAFGFSLNSEQCFNHLAHLMSYFWVRFVVWVFLSTLVFHLLAGIRHLLMDIHLGESLRWGRIGAWFVLLLSIVVIVLMGICLFWGGV